MQSDAKTVQEYLDSLPEDRKKQISDTRDVILKNLDKGFQEVMNWGMICYEIPLEVFPDTYNKKPLLYAALASQKNHMAVYMSGIYMDENLLKKFTENYKASGKKLNMGKSCVRFTKIENLPLDVIGNAIASYTAESFLDFYKESRKK